MADRYFVSPPIAGDRAILTGPEAHHVLHVMRARPGEEVTLFDGSGAEFSARVDRLGRTEVELAVLGREEVDRELATDITLGVALPKGDRQRWLVEKAVELGVRRIVPLRTARSVVQPGGHALARLERAVVEASKQCGRNRLLTITPPESWADFLHQADAGACRLLAHPGLDGTGLARCNVAKTSDRVWLAVGPEGGFTEEEVAMAAAAGWEVLDLGHRILRIETAAIVMVALVATAGKR